VRNKNLQLHWDPSELYRISIDKEASTHEDFFLPIRDVHMLTLCSNFCQEFSNGMKRARDTDDGGGHGDALRHKTSGGTANTVGIKRLLVLLKLLVVVMVSTADGYYYLKSMFEEKLHANINVD
nr:protein NRT1/ PTR FAMILY 4.5-like [Tanacetum cinerariifolium]